MLLNNLKQEEKKNIYNYIRTYANEGNEPSVDVDCLLRFWVQNKEDLYKLFGNQFIVEKKVEISAPKHDLEDKLEKKMWDYDDDDMYKFAHNFRSFVRNIETSADSKDRVDWYDIAGLFSSSALASNKFERDTFNVIYNGKKITCQTGSKPVKMIGKLVKLFGYDEEEFEKFRLAQSLVTNARKLTGTLCLSIHPLDYMTMSDNEEGWSSCMSWHELGCYCGGTVEMMNSPAVVVGYLKSEDDCDQCYGFDKFSWNSKKWRQLFIVTHNFVSSIKGYPYQNDELAFDCLNLIKELAEKNWGLHYEEPYKYDYDSDEASFRTNAMYNDFGTCKHHMMRAEGFDEKISFNYSGPRVCMHCGVEEPDFYDEGQLVCDRCNDCARCDDCGDRIRNGDGYELDGNYYCESCYEQHVFTDPVTEESHDIDNSVNVYFFPQDFNIDENTPLWQYPHVTVYDESLDSDIADFADGVLPHVYRRGEWGRKYYYYTTDEISDKTLDLFEYDDCSHASTVEELVNYIYSI